MIPEGISLISPQRLDNLKAFLRVAPPGAVVEVGTYWGGTLRRLAVACPDRQCYGYDTFTGMPVASGKDNHYKEGDLQVDYDSVLTTMTGVGNVVLVRGLYPWSDYLRPCPVALAHIDVDIYSSTINAMRWIYDLMCPGGRIYCDDAGESECEGATAAMQEFSGEKGLTIEMDPDWHQYLVVP
jgi:O-methyltransferase